MTSGTKEWAKRNCNLEQTGCEHDCKYGYCKSMAIRFKRATAESWKTPVIVGTKGVHRRRVKGVVMFPTAHDVTRKNYSQCRDQLRLLYESGDNVLFVSKASPLPLSMALSDFGNPEMPIMDETRVEVRVTIGSANDTVLKYWEPGAPSFADRLAALKWAHDNGFPTSVSMEPMLDVDPMAVVDAVTPFVSPDRGIWLGTANDLVRRVATNCPGDEIAKLNARDLECRWWSGAVRQLYLRYKDNPLIHWKDSIRKVVGI